MALKPETVEWAKRNDIMFKSAITCDQGHMTPRKPGESLLSLLERHDATGHLDGSCKQGGA